MRVRGLKLGIAISFIDFNSMSHPMRVRGLKPFFALYSTLLNSVAPHAGAWIETHYSGCVN